MTSIKKCQAIVIRRVNYAEADRIITFLTDHEEQITLIAKGSRKAKSKMASSIELFTTSEISYVSKNGNMGTLTSIRLISNYRNISQELSRIELGSKIIKLIDKISKHQTHSSRWYEILQRSFEYLDIQRLDGLTIYLLTVFDIINDLGLLPNYPTKLSDESLLFEFDYQNKNFSENAHGTFTINHFKIIKLLLSGQTGLLFRLKDYQDQKHDLVLLFDKIILEDL